MLDSLSIRDVVLIDRLEIVVEPLQHAIDKSAHQKPFVDCDGTLRSEQLRNLPELIASTKSRSSGNPISHFR